MVRNVHTVRKYYYFTSSQSQNRHYNITTITRIKDKDEDLTVGKVLADFAVQYLQSFMLRKVTSRRGKWSIISSHRAEQ